MGTKSIMPLTAKWIYSAALLRSTRQDSNARCGLEGETATPVMQLKLWMYFITTDTFKVPSPFFHHSLCLFFFSFFFSLFFFFFLFLFISLQDRLHFHARGLCAGEGLGG